MATLGWVSIFTILNLMTVSGVSFYLTASVLGYCLLPMVLLSAVAVLLKLRYIYNCKEYLIYDIIQRNHWFYIGYYKRLMVHILIFDLLCGSFWDAESTNINCVSDFPALLVFRIDDNILIKFKRLEKIILKSLLLSATKPFINCTFE